MLKENIIEYNKAWITSQESYAKIEGINKTNHVPYPEPLQKLIVTSYCDWNLIDADGCYDKKIDFKIKDSEILVEMKSITALNGAVGLTETQADYANELI